MGGVRQDDDGKVAFATELIVPLARVLKAREKARYFLSWIACTAQLLSRGIFSFHLPKSHRPANFPCTGSQAPDLGIPEVHVSTPLACIDDCVGAQTRMTRFDGVILGVVRPTCVSGVFFRET